MIKRIGFACKHSITDSSGDVMTSPEMNFKTTKSVSKDHTCCEIEFIAFAHEHDPEPMINLLQGVLNTQQTVL